MSEDSYEYDDESGSESVSEGDEFYYEDDSEQELEGGAYELATDYIDGMGMGYGGVLMGGAAKKKKSAVTKKKTRCISDYNLFFKKYRSAPYKKTPEQIAKMWRSGKYRVPPRKAPKGRKLCPSQKKKRGYLSKSGSKKSVKRSPSTKKKMVRRKPRGTLCDANGRYYVTKRNYDIYCNDPRYAINKIVNPGKKYYGVSNACPPKQRYCPITGRCRRLPESIIDCYNQANIPYVYADNGVPSALYYGSDHQYAIGDNISSYSGNRDVFLRGKMIKKKN